jgi:tetratricopeptide (TPR) repeat protein
MKAVHHKLAKKDIPLVQWLAETRLLEKDEKEQAVREYKQIVLTYPGNENAYNRLMILFRQLKQTKNELYWINKAIDYFQKRFQKPAAPANSRIAKISKSIAQATGLTDKKGNPLFQPEPIGRWQKRKASLLKKTPGH